MNVRPGPELPTGGRALGSTVDPVEDDAGPVPAEDPSTGDEDRDGPSDKAGPGEQARSGETEVGADGNDANAEPGHDPEDGEVRDPLRFNNWMKRSATGAVMTGIAVGLQQALQLPRQEPAFVIEASGEPHDPNHPIDLHFDPDNPADTVAVIRRPKPATPTEEPSPPA